MSTKADWLPYSDVRPETVPVRHSLAKSSRALAVAEFLRACEGSLRPGPCRNVHLGQREVPEGSGEMPLLARAQADGGVLVSIGSGPTSTQPSR